MTPSTVGAGILHGTRQRNRRKPMGLMFRRRRPLARLAVGAATAGVAYNAGQRRATQDQYNEQASEAYEATQAPQQYVPPTPAPGTSQVAELGRLSSMHDAGALTDEEFAAAKASLLGL
jgi:hypothetical protein